MILVPAVFALVLLVISPSGTIASDLVARYTGLSPSLSLAVLTVFIIGAGSALLAAARLAAPPDRLPDEDDLWEIGSGRVQGVFSPLLVLTLVAAAAAIYYVPVDRDRLMVAAGVAIAALLPIPLLSTVWPPPLPVYRASVRTEGKAHDPTLEEPAADEPGLIERTYNWVFQDSRTAIGGNREIAHAMSMRIRQSTYDEFRNRQHPEPHNDPDGYAVLGKYARDGITAEVRICSRVLGKKCIDLNLPYLDLVNFVLAFTRDSFPYASDQETHGKQQYTNYPIETLVEKRGDCEDHAILAATVLREMGMDTILIVMEQTDGKAHAALGVRATSQLPGTYVEFEGRRYYYCEATPAGTWRFGEIPADLSESLKSITPIPLFG